MTRKGGWRCLRSGEVLHVGVEDAEALWANTARLDPGDLLGGGHLAHRDGLPPVLPGPLASRLRRFGARGAPKGALLIRGLLPNLTDLAPTPVPPVPPGGAGCDADRAAGVLLAVMSVLGEPRAARDGRLVQHVVPVLGQDDTPPISTSTSDGGGGGGELLPWSVEDAYDDDRCQVLGLLCLRGAPEAVTVFSRVRAGDLALIAQLILRDPLFTIAPDLAQRGGARAPVAVLSGPAGDLRVRLDSIHLTPRDPRDCQAATALYHLHEVLQHGAVGHVMEPGDLLVLDNRRVAQARVHLEPRRDGSDQWLLRVMVGQPEQER